MKKYILIAFSFITLHTQAMEIELSSNKQSRDPLIIQQFKRLRDDLKKSNVIRVHNQLNKKKIICKIDQQTDMITYRKEQTNYIEPSKPDYIFGSKIIHETLSLQQKKYCINQLIKDFPPFPEERDLSFLEWWERIPFNKMILVHCAAIKNQTIFSVLPHEVILLIAFNMAYTTESLL